MPHTTTGVPPCEMLMNRKLRSRLDLFHPKISGKVESHQAKQKELCDQRSLRQFTENGKVYVQDFTTRKPKWIPGTVIEVTGLLTYMIKLQDGATVQRHVDHVRKRENSIVDQDFDTMVFDLSSVLMRPPNFSHSSDLSRRLSAGISKVRNAKCFSGN